MRRHQTRTAYTFLLVPLIFFLIVRFLPTFSALRLSLFDWNILKDTQPFVGTENYQRLFADEKFGQALRNTALYTVVGVPAQIALGLIVALLLNKIVALRGVSGRCTSPPTSPPSWPPRGSGSGCSARSSVRSTPS